MGQTNSDAESLTFPIGPTFSSSPIPPPSQPLWVPYSLLLNVLLIYKFMSSSFTALPFDLQEEKKNYSVNLLNVFLSQTPVLYIRSLAFHDCWILRNGLQVHVSGVKIGTSVLFPSLHSCHTVLILSRVMDPSDWAEGRSLKGNVKKKGIILHFKRFFSQQLLSTGEREWGWQQTLQGIHNYFISPLPPPNTYILQKFWKTRWVHSFNILSEHPLHAKWLGAENKNMWFPPRATELIIYVEHKRLIGESQKVTLQCFLGICHSFWLECFSLNCLHGLLPTSSRFSVFAVITILGGLQWPSIRLFFLSFCFLSYGPSIPECKLYENKDCLFLSFLFSEVLSELKQYIVRNRYSNNVYWMNEPSQVLIRGLRKIRHIGLRETRHFPGEVRVGLI